MATSRNCQCPPAHIKPFWASCTGCSTRGWRPWAGLCCSRRYACRSVRANFANPICWCSGTGRISAARIATGWGADLVAEVVSPDNPDRDLVTKRSDYAEAGIPEYWIADPRNETITVLKLSSAASAASRTGESRIEQTYAEHGVFSRGQKATSVLFDGLAVDVAAAFDASKPRKQTSPTQAAAQATLPINPAATDSSTP